MKLAIIISLISSLTGVADVYRDYEEPGTRNDYRGNPENFSRRTDHFLFRFGPENKQGVLTEQLFQSQLQFLEHVYDTWRAVGLHELGGSDPVKYRTVIEPGQSWAGDLEGTAVGFGVGNEVPGLHIPANALLAAEPNGCTPHELGHGWQNQGRAFGGGLPALASPGFTEALSNWVMQLHLVDYSHDWPAMGFPYGHACISYNLTSFFNAFMDEPGYGADFINDLIYEPNLGDFNDMTADDVIRKAIRLDRSGAKDKAGAIHDVLGRLNARMLNMDFWNYRKDIPYGVGVDRNFEGFFFNRVKMVKQPGVEGGWLRPEWTCVPQYLMNSYIPLKVEGRLVECDFQPVADPVRKTAFRACFVAFDQQDQPRYSKLWNAGRKSFELADDDVSVYLAIIPCPEKSNPSLIHNDYLSEHPAIFPYRINLTGAEPLEWDWKAPGSGFKRHGNGGGIVADSAHVDKTAFVGKDAMVLGNAKVYGNSRIEDFVLVTDEATIGREGQADGPVVSGHAHVQGKAKVHGQAKVREHAWLWGESEVSGQAVVMAHTMLDGAIVDGNAVMNQAPLRDKGLAMNGRYGGGAMIGGDLSQGGEFMTQIACEYPTRVDDGKYQYLGYNFEKDSCVFALDQWGLNHSYLINYPVLVSAEIGGVETTALKLDGNDQYIELRPDAVDFSDLTIAFWVCNEGTDANAVVCSFGDGEGKIMRFTADGRLAATDGERTETLSMRSGLRKGEWVHVAMTFEGNTVTLFANGRKVASNPRFTINPDDLHAPLMNNANFIGRGNDGGYLKGMIDEFKVIRRVLPEPEIALLMKDVEAGEAPRHETNPPAPPVWLVTPEVVGDGQAYEVVTQMSAAVGEDPNGMLYSFLCKNDPSFNSGWISENRYVSTANGGEWTIKLKDRFGNESAESPLAVAVPAASEIEAPKMEVSARGLSGNSIRISAPHLTGAGGLVRYRFSRNESDVNSGWVARHEWVDDKVSTEKEYSYKVEIRDGLGNIHSTNTGGVVARDDTAPQLKEDFRWQWSVYPYVRLDKTVRLKVRKMEESGVEYYFECVENPALNSGWASTNEWITQAMDHGEYSFRYKVRDSSPQKNESQWSVPKSASVTAANTFADYPFENLASLPLETLVCFEGLVTKVEERHYVVSARDSEANIRVIPRAFMSQTDPTMLNRNVRVRGHLWEFDKVGRVVDYAIVASDPQTGRIEFEDSLFPEEKIFPQFSSAASKSEYLGWHRDGWYVDMENVASAKDFYLGYALGGPLKIHVNGKLQKEVELQAVGGKDDFKIQKIDGLQIPEGATLRFSGSSGLRLDHIGIGVSYHEIAGRVVSDSGEPMVNAAVYFSRKAPAIEFVELVARTDAEGRYHQLLESGTWHVVAAAEGIKYRPSPDRILTITDRPSGSVDFKLETSRVHMDFPQEDQLLFAGLTDMLPAQPWIQAWDAYRPEGFQLQGMSNLGPGFTASDGYSWFVNTFDAGSGFMLPRFSNDIPIQGATVIARVDHKRNEDGENWRSIVEVFFDRLMMGVQNFDGKIYIKRNDFRMVYPVTLPEEPVVMSMVVQANGRFKVYIDGKEVISEDSESDMTRFEVNSNKRPFANQISIGRGFDAWSTFNGKVGDVCLYKVALSDREREAVEKQFMTKR